MYRCIVGVSFTAHVSASGMSGLSERSGPAGWVGGLTRVRLVRRLGGGVIHQHHNVSAQCQNTIGGSLEGTSHPCVLELCTCVCVCVSVHVHV